MAATCSWHSLLTSWSCLMLSSTLTCSCLYSRDPSASRSFCRFLSLSLLTRTSLSSTAASQGASALLDSSTVTVGHPSALPVPWMWRSGQHSSTDGCFWNGLFQSTATQHQSTATQHQSTATQHHSHNVRLNTVNSPTNMIKLYNLLFYNVRL